MAKVPIEWRENIAENFNRLSKAHERYRQIDGTAIACSERECEFTFAKKNGTKLLYDRHVSGST